MPVRKATPKENAKAAPASIALGEDAAKAEVERATASVPAIVEQANAIEVRSEAEAIQAGEFLAVLKRTRTDAEAARKALVKPLNDHVKFINEGFKAKTGPLDEADQIVRGKVVAYETEQDRLRREEQERREREAAAERERQEAEARAAREKAEQEAREAQEAAAAAAAAQEQADRDDAGDLEHEVRELSDEELARTRDALGDEGGMLARAVIAELERREEIAQAAADAERARLNLEAAEAAEAEISARPVDVEPVKPSGPIRAGSGTVSIRTRKVYEVVDEARVPRRFLMIDHKAMNAAVQAGETDIPGVEIHEEKSAAVRAA